MPKKSPQSHEEANETTPKTYRVTIEGTTPIIFHRFTGDAMKAQQTRTKAEKKQGDLPADIEAYTYRDSNGYLAISGEALRGALLEAAKTKSSQINRRASARQDYNSSLVIQTPYPSLGVKKWDYVDERGVCIQNRSARVIRKRPAMSAGWRATCEIVIIQPSLISGENLLQNIKDAGNYVGLAEMRPQYGRFKVIVFREI